jgi:hypothetical protein
MIIYILLITTLLSVCKCQDLNEAYKFEDTMTNPLTYISPLCYKKSLQQMTNFEEILGDYRKHLLNTLGLSNKLCEIFNSLSKKNEPDLSSESEGKDF